MLLVFIKKNITMNVKFNEFTLKETHHPDSIRINNKNVTGYLNALQFQDADTNQFVVYFPALEISGYGETIEKAFELAKFSISGYFAYLHSLSIKNRELELITRGWKVGKYKNKDYSKVYVDAVGELKNFNVVEGKVKHLTIEAA